MNISVARLKPRKKRYQVSIDRGLVIRVQPSGIKSWIVRLPKNGRIIDVTIGHYPELSIAQAKQIARQKRTEFSLEPPNGYTFKDAFVIWCSLKKNNIVSYRGEKRRIEKYIVSKIGNQQIDRITAPAIVQLLKPLSDSGKRSTLKRCVMRLREILDIAVCAGFLRYNPCPKLSRIFPAPKVRPMPSLPWQKLSDVLIEVFKQDNSKFENLFLLSLCLLLRPKEVASLRWSWIKDDVLTIPAEVMKMRKEHRVPLSPYCLELLTKIKKETPHKRSAYVFSGIRSNRHINAQTLSKYLRDSALRGKLVAHGLRSIGRSWMADNGIDFETAEGCLAHSFGNSVSKAYLRSDLLESRKKAMLAWNSHVQDCVCSARENLENTEGLKSCGLNTHQND